MKTIQPVCLKILFVISFLIWLQPDTWAQELRLLPLDSIITVGYATGNRKTISGSVERITEQGMNRDQITNPLEALRGRIAGLTIQKGNNGPAALDAVRLRGTTSLTSGNDPLIIVDGVFGDLNMLMSIYPADIENFTILKDASETAQYGSRGASGVIEITTKKGVNSKTQVNYNGSFGVASVYKNLRMLSADEFRDFAKEQGIAILDKGNNTDFQKEIEQTGLQQNHHIAFYGGSDASSYRISLGFVDRQGIILNEDMKNFTSNMNMMQKMFDGFVKCEIGMFGSIQKNRNIVDYQKTFYSAATFNPTYPDHKNAETGAWDQITNASQITNPLAWMEVKDKDANSYISTHARLTFNLLEDLKLIAFGAYTYNIIENSQYLPTSVWAHGQAYKGTKKSETLLGNLMLNYIKDIKKHHLDALALAELQKETYTGYYTTSTNFSTDKLGYDNLQAGAVRPWEGTGSYYEQPKLVSFLGRLNYAYADRYILTVNARTDASSKFGVNHKWGFFPSVSAAWVISEEQFMKRFSWLDNLKLRVGYGLSGNQNGIDSYTALRLVKPNGVVPIGSAPTVTLAELSNTNPDLKWEESEQLDFGIDFGFFNNALTFTADYYKKTTNGMLMEMNIPSYVGESKPIGNVGKMENSGLELEAAYRFRVSDWNFRIGGNLTYLKNKLIEYGNESGWANLDSFQGTGTISRAQNGKPFPYFYGYKTAGVFQNMDEVNAYTNSKGELIQPNAVPGDVRFVDVDGSGSIDADDRTDIGKGMPDWTYGLNLNVSWKNFDLSMMWQGTMGNDIYDATRRTDISATNLPSWMLNRWTGEGTSNRIPRFMLGDNTNWQSSDLYVYDGSYLRLKNIQIGYTLPAALTQKVFVSSLRFYVAAENLFTFTKYHGFDPEISSGGTSLGVDYGVYPQARTWTIGANLTF